MTTVDLRDVTPGLAYQIASTLVVPRPIAFVSTVSVDGQPNLAPFSFFNVGGANPPSLMFCTVLGPNGEPKDTLTNIVQTRELVVNLVDRAMALGMNATSPTHPPEIDEWPLSGFTPIDSHLVRPRRVAESPVQLECRLHQIIEHGTGPSSSRYIVAEIVLAHLADGILTDQGIRPVNLIARLGGAEYLDMATGSRFQLPRPGQ